MTEPKKISDYQVVDVLGRGGMGVVYEAVHPDGHSAAVKTVRVATESTLESIRREIMMLRELKHPGIVAIRDHGIAADGMPWYAMELLRGRTLRDDLRVWFPAPAAPDDSTKDLKAPGRLRAMRAAAVESAVREPEPTTPPYSLAHIATVFRKICEPLAYVHGQGVIHRDLSPGNIFLVGADEPVLFDFGLAAQFDSAREVLEVGGYARGTAHYMAPEQARGEVVDARADVYALGCILYEALTGRPPFLDDGTSTVLMQHIEATPVPPSRYAPGVAAFDELVMRMLAKHPRDRLGYAEDVATALAALGGAAPIAHDRPRPRAYTYRAGLAGREEVLARFDAHVRELVARRGGCAALIGESGAGKTRLAGEIATRAASLPDVRVITGECEPVAVADVIRAAALHPLRPLLRAIADRCREGGRGEADRLLGVDGGLLAAYEPALAGFARTIDLVGTGAIGAGAARSRVLSVLRDVVAAFASSEPLVLVLDDLQWADELTLAFLRSLSQTWFAQTPLFILGTARAGEVSPELQLTLASLHAEQLSVTRLDRAAIGTMVRDMLALGEEVPALADYVATRSEGNPLFAAEYLRIAVDEGVVERDPGGRWRLSQRNEDSYDKLPTPGSVQELGRRRLRQLGEDARELAIAAAVLGRACDVEVLTATAGVSADVSRHAVAELILRHVVLEADGQLRFEHDSLRELAYAELTEPGRAALHGSAARALEARYQHAAELALRFAELAHHWEQAGDRARATGYLERGTDHAFETAAYGEARTMLERLLVLAVDAPRLERGRWLRRLGVASYALGDVAGLATHTRRALDELGRPLPASRLRLAASVAAGVGRQLWSRTLRRPSAGAAEPAVVEAALASAQMTTHFFFNDDSLGLVGAALAAVNLAERGGDNLPIAEIYAQLGYAAGIARLGGVARTYFTQARATATATHDTVGLIKTMCTEAAFAICVGAWGDARAASTEALALARSVRNPQEAEDALTILGHVEFATGNYPLAHAMATELRESARARSNIQHEAWGAYTEGRAALYVGDLELAIERLDTAMTMLAHQHDRASLILCGGLQACALARRGDPRARAAADAVTARIAGKTPPVFSITEGLVGLADAYLVLWRTDPSLAAPTRAAIAELAKLARLLPIAGPAAANRLGLYHAHAGSPRRAARALRRGLALATRLAIPYEQAIARAALA